MLPLSKKIKLHHNKPELKDIFTDRFYRNILHIICKYLHILDIVNIAKLCKKANNSIIRLDWSILFKSHEFENWNFIKEESTYILHNNIRDGKILLENANVSYLFSRIPLIMVDVAINNNKFVKVPDLRNDKQLTSLQLRNDNLSMVPALPLSITALDLSYNDFSLGPIDFSKLENLISLKLIDCKLKKFPLIHHNIEYINLSENDFSSIEINISEYTEITTIKLNKCNLYKLPILPTYISKLYLSNNNFYSVKLDLSNYTEINTLKLINCNLNNIPILSYLPRTLDLSNNDFSSVKLDFSHLGNFEESIYNTSSIKLVNCKINKIPIFNKNIKYDTIKLKNNNIEKFKGLKNISIGGLYLCGNKIKEINAEEIIISLLKLNNNQIKILNISGEINDLFLINNPVKYFNCNSDEISELYYSGYVKDFNIFPSTVEILQIHTSDIESFAGYENLYKMDYLGISVEKLQNMDILDLSKSKKLTTLSLKNYNIKKLILPKTCRYLCLTSANIEEIIGGMDLNIEKK